MIVEQKVIKEGFQFIHDEAKARLEEIDSVMNQKIETNEEISEAKETINRVTNEILEEFADKKLSYETILENTMEVVEVEVPDPIEESDTEESEEGQE